MSALDKAITHSKNIGIDEFEIISIKKNITTVRITDYSQFGSYAELIKINKFRYKNPREE